MSLSETRQESLYVKLQTVETKALIQWVSLWKPWDII